MADDPRAPQHPSDMPSSRASGGSSSVGPPPANTPYTPPPQPGSSGSNQTRNIIIGAIATIIASTTVYYLTQYVNLRKSDSTASPVVVKDATLTAWKTYVTIDKIYYKNIIALAKNKSLIKDLDKYEEEMGKESDRFLKDIDNLAKEKSIDKTFVTMIKRREKREKDAKVKAAEFYAAIKSIAKASISKAEKEKKLKDEVVIPYTRYLQMVFEMSATELEELSRVLSEKFLTSFDPMQMLIFADFKKGLFNFDTAARHHHGDSLVAAKNIDPKKLVGKWSDEGNKLHLRNDGTMSYLLVTGIEGSGVWKLEDDFLRLDAVDNTSKLKTINFWGIFNFKPDTFFIRLTSPPNDIYKLGREKE